MATLGFPDAETKWAYSAIIDMLNDRDRPLTDDAGFICGFTGLSRKKWAIVRRYLLETESGSGEPFLQLTDRGDLTNPRFERERAERRSSHEDSVEFGRAGGRKSAALRAAGQTELDLPDGEDSRAHAPARSDPARKSGRKSPDSTPNSRVESAPNGAEKPRGGQSKSNGLAQPPPQATRARQTPEIREEDSPRPAAEPDPPVRAHARETPPDRLNDHDLQDLVDAVCDASGYRPVSPGQLDRAFRIVKEWRDAGFDFTEVVVPTVKAVVSESRDPTRTLGRFTARIRHEHARLKAKGEAGTPYRPPVSPVLDVPGEGPAVRAIRAELLKRVGTAVYCAVANTARLEPVTDAAAGRAPLRVISAGPASLNDGHTGTVLAQIAKRHGFTEIW
ncbi:MAG: hypothetical protein ACJ8DZ_13790 [Allosphingosinicella sp.]